MPTPFLYLTTILVWSSTWYVINFQIGVVDPRLSVAYRFLLASGILFLWCVFRRLPLRFSKKDHFFLILQGLCQFGVAYQCCYMAAQYISSGINALAFSLIIVFNIINARLFYGSPLTTRVVSGALLGILGMGLVFWKDVIALDHRSLIGITLSTAGALLASLGNMIGTRHHRHALPITQTNAFAMLYGGLSSLTISVALGIPLLFDFSWAYVGSHLYLSLFGSIVAFGCYIQLLGSIGPQRAAYALILTPIVALGVSTFLEGFQWTQEALYGVGLIMVGNILVLGNRQRIGGSSKPRSLRE